MKKERFNWFLLFDGKKINHWVRKPTDSDVEACLIDFFSSYDIGHNVDVTLAYRGRERHVYSVSVESVEVE